MPESALKTAARLLARCRERGLTLATAESCTGGLIAACLTEIAGSSDVVDRGFVTYSNAAKTEMLGVAAATLEHHGAVSAETAAEMVRGALARSPADLAIAVTGIAGPGGATATKPVGLVSSARSVAARRRGSSAMSFQGDRRAVRTAALERALALLERAAIG
ncbi:MAG: CinA family protein [Geminicoccaceae bacterium]|nr:CinA family protein [Geminicoccaceae bacterium]